MDLALLILRVVFGLAVAAHGSQKLFGWFGGGGIKGTSGFIGMMGFRPVRFWAVMSGLGEFGGGALLALGLVNPIGPLAVIAAMLTAIVSAHWEKGFWASKGGYELPLAFLTGAATVALAGPGRYALDTALSISLPPTVQALLAVIAIAGAVVGLASRRPAAATQQRTTA